MAVGTLIKQSNTKVDSNLSKPSDYPAVGPTGPAGMSKGDNQLVKQTDTQQGPRGLEDSGDNTPSVWGKENWTVATNGGEAGTSPSALSYTRQGVSCVTGQMTVNAIEATD
jgi:hypothetical protein